MNSLKTQTSTIGIALFDQLQTLKDSNDAWGHFLELPPDLIECGTNYEDILKFRAELTQLQHRQPDFVDLELAKLSTQQDVYSMVYSTSGNCYKRTLINLYGGGFIEMIEVNSQYANSHEPVVIDPHTIPKDEITGVTSRAGFIVLLEKLISIAIDSGTSVSLFFVTLENFQETVDITDHALADRILARVAQRLTALSGNSSAVGRLLGAEFAILKTNLTNADQEAVFAESLIRSFQMDAVHLDDLFDIDIPISIGIARAPENGTGSIQLMRNANLALSRARKNRSRPFQFFHREMSELAMRKSLIKLDLRTALERNELGIAYQPKIDLKTNRIIGMEALMRWQHPEFGKINPDEFIPVAERTGLIAPMTQWLMTEACRSLRNWQHQGFTNLRLALNLSTIHFRRQSVIGNITEALENSGIDPELIEIEITEGALITDDEVIINTFSWLKDIGIRISVDDFGVGYSSLSYLQKFNIDTIKVDMSFVRNMHIKPIDAAITRGIIRLAHSLGKSVVAEGVELAVHRDYLCAEGCDIGQGYYWSKPLNNHEFDALLIRNNNQPFLVE